MDFKIKAEAAITLCDELIHAPKYSFSELKPSKIPDTAGVYAIFNQFSGGCLYVGRTKNLRQRLYYNHLMGPLSNARLKKYLIADPFEENVVDLQSAKQYLKEQCYVQFILEPDLLHRGQMEGLFSYFLNVRYLYEEH